MGVQDRNLPLARELLSNFRVTKHGSRKPLRVVSDPLSYEVRDHVSRRNKGPLSLSRYPRTLWRPGVLNFEGDSVCAVHSEVSSGRQEKGSTEPPSRIGVAFRMVASEGRAPQVLGDHPPEGPVHAHMGNGAVF